MPRSGDNGTELSSAAASYFCTSSGVFSYCVVYTPTAPIACIVMMTIRYLRECCSQHNGFFLAAQWGPRLKAGPIWDESSNKADKTIFTCRALERASRECPPGLVARGSCTQTQVQQAKCPIVPSPSALNISVSAKIRSCLKVYGQHCCTKLAASYENEKSSVPRSPAPPPGD